MPPRRSESDRAQGDHVTLLAVPRHLGMRSLLDGRLIFIGVIALGIQGWIIATVPPEPSEPYWAYIAIFELTLVAGLGLGMLAVVLGRTLSGAVAPSVGIAVATVGVAWFIWPGRTAADGAAL